MYGVFLSTIEHDKLASPSSKDGPQGSSTAPPRSLDYINCSPYFTLNMLQVLHSTPPWDTSWDLVIGIKILYYVSLSCIKETHIVDNIDRWLRPPLL